MIPFQIVIATAPPKKRPRKFPPADRMTAFAGVRTRVATIVEIAFAASVNPFQNAKKRATPIPAYSRSEAIGTPPSGSSPRCR